MLERDQVLSAYPEGYRHQRRNILREYLQMKTLKYLYSSPLASSLLFIGGTAIRLVYGSDRFWEDLDFDLRNQDISLEKLAQLVQKGLHLEGVNCDVKIHQPKGDGAWSARLRFFNILQRWGLTGHKDEVLLIKLDAEPQYFSYSAETYPLIV